MTQASCKMSEKSSWQEALSDLVTDSKELLTLLELDPDLLAGANLAAQSFSLKVPRAFVARMEKGNPNDPLLKQVLPLNDELIISPGYNHDPLGEKAANPIPGLLHKYKSRVLVTLTSACAIHCRYCFRRHFPYSENNPGRIGWEKLFGYLIDEPEVNEVILSGGDPLSVSDKLLTLFSEQMLKVPHIKRLRIHTRLPIVLPERITSSFLAWIKSLPIQVVMVIHANHPREINAEVAAVLHSLRKHGVHLLNQSVLLKGVNDDANILTLLSETLFEAGVLPYYLHVLDKVQGAAHFDLAIQTAKSLHALLCKNLPGYLVPKLVREEAGKLAKTLL